MNDYQSWGRFPRAKHPLVHRLRWRHEGWPTALGSELTVLPYGSGRSYGDCCLNDGGALLDTRGLDRFIAFDREAGTLKCEAGVTLEALIAVTLPHGWFPAVVPGTRFVTVGGAIANDVHGKNHHRIGTFGHHVRRLELLRSDGTRLTCSPTENEAMFRATIGGLGLTGLILSAELALRRIGGPRVAVERIAFASLDAYLALAKSADRTHEYTAAWVDCLARGPRLGRGILFRANSIAGPVRASSASTGAGPSIPFELPFSVVSGPAMRAFNTAYQLLQRARPAHSVTALLPHLFPLDKLRNWNRLYGKAGFVQYQCVVPPAGTDALSEVLQMTAEHGAGSFLAVLKSFGKHSPAGLLSFPRSGYTLTLDFPQRGSRTQRLLERFDSIVAGAGGAVYPAKDASMTAGNFRRYFPQWEALEAQRDPRFSSSFWRRVTGAAA
jgi:FAD/FMN-containing dehydrogenase